MEDKIFEMVIESMKQKLIFSDMVEMRKIVRGAVHMMEAHYEAKIPSNEKKEDLIYELRERLTNGRDYLMQVETKDLTVGDCLEALGFGRNGLRT